MAYQASARTAPPRRLSALVAGLLLVVAAIEAVPGSRLLPSSSPPTASPVHVPDEHGEDIGAPGEGGSVLRAASGGALGAADGAVPSGTTVFDDSVPGVAKLDPALLGALRRAAIAAARDGVRFAVDSGWRSRAYQERLFREAVGKYGSEEAAARWVATADTSAHVSGDAVDLGPAKAKAWLSRQGANDGLCQIYRNEPWHYEWRPDAIRHGCPGMYADPTHDPRMRR